MYSENIQENRPFFKSIASENLNQQKEIESLCPKCNYVNVISY